MKRGTGVPQSLPFTDERNELWLRRLRAWKAAGAELWVWYYTANHHFTLSPKPTVYIEAD